MTDLASSPEAIEFLIDGARYGDAEDVIKALDEYKVAVDATDEQGRTALHMASANGHVEIAAMLLKRDADPDACNDQDNTPLHWACLNGKEQVVRLLMQAGASPSSINAQGRTPVDEALGRPFQDAILSVVNSFGKTTDRLDDDDDPESGDVEMEEQVPDPNDSEQSTRAENTDLQPYNKYGGSGQD